MAHKSLYSLRFKLNLRGREETDTRNSASISQISQQGSPFTKLTFRLTSNPQEGHNDLVCMFKTYLLKCSLNIK